MVIFGYKIERNEKLSTNPMTIWFLGMMVPLLYMAVISSHFLAYYRLGDSIIPSEAQLQSSGPYVMRKHSERAATYIDFISAHDGTTYTIKDLAFPKKTDILEIVDKSEHEPVAYLGLYLDNPAQKIWRVTVHGDELLTHDRALFWYHIHANPSWWIKACILNFLMFLCSLFTTTKVAPRKLSPQPEKAN